MAEEQLIELEGRVVQVLPGTMFRVELPNKHVVLGRISGKLRKNFIKIIAGDQVRVEMDPADVTQARIVYRLRGSDQRARFGNGAQARPGGGNRR
jgi:translation initiation factor IF-1